MKLFERVTEQRLRSYPEDIGFINNQSGFRQNKSTDDHLFRLSKSVMESFSRGEHIMAAFLDVEKAFDNVWHNGLRYKIFMLDLPTKMTGWIYDFLVVRVIQVNVNGFLSDQISSIAGVVQASVRSPLLFLIYVNGLPKPHHRQKSKSQFADDTALWAASKNIQFAVKLLRRDLRKLAKWCNKWRIKLNPENTKVMIYSPGSILKTPRSSYILQVPSCKKVRTHPETSWREAQNLSSSEISRNHFGSKFTFQEHFEEILGRCNTRYSQPVHHITNLQQ